MNLRTRMLLALLPLALAVAALGVLSAIALDNLGRHSAMILEDNYRSVLAAQTMKDALERLDSEALYALAGRPGPIHGAGARRYEEVFEQELQVEEGNITEAGEREVAVRLREAWSGYRAGLERFRALGDPDAQRRAYFEGLEPAFGKVKAEADRVLALNQDAMVRKSDRAQRSAERLTRYVVGSSLLVAALALWASSALTRRFLRPLNVVGQAVRRFGEGDLAIRARVTGRDEIGLLASDFNTMADRLERYRKSSLGELLQAQRGAQAAIDSLTDAVVMFGPGGSVLNANQSALALGVDPESNQPLARVEPPVRAVLDRLAAHVFSGAGPYQPHGFEDAVRLDTPEGPRQLLPRASPIYGEGGEVSGVAVVLSDITKLLRADELKTNLVAFVAHEFRTPLTSLQMAIHLCLEQVVGPITEKQADLLQAARSDCERLQAIVDDLLDASRMQQGRIELARGGVEISKLVEDALETQRASAEARQVRLRSEVLPDTGEVWADPEKVHLVFDNLLGNALRYTPAGGAVTVRARREDDAMRFEVRDTGPGIPKEQQPLVFEKFYRVSGDREQGVGLGLFIAREIVSAHGGRIGIESEPGRGTTVWFTLPAAQRERPAPAA